MGGRGKEGSREPDKQRKKRKRKAERERDKRKYRKEGGNRCIKIWRKRRWREGDMG